MATSQDIRFTASADGTSLAYAVTTLSPGWTATEFAMGAGRTPDMPGLADMMRPEDVASAVVTVLKQPRTMRTLLWSMRSIHEAD